MVRNDRRLDAVTERGGPALRRGPGTLALVFILFFCTSGGPYTIETLVHDVGPD
jgi:hypothetical protein